MTRKVFAWLTLTSVYLEASFDEALGKNADRFGTASTKISDQILNLLRTNAGVTALAAHLITRPSVPAVVAIEHLLFQSVGEDAFTDDMKQYTGWRVRQIIEELGGRWVRAGVRIRGSRYQTGSIYQLD